MTTREQRLQHFLQEAGWGGADRRHLADDASFRRYERIVRGERRAVLMDAPPPQEKIRPFHDIQRLLLTMDLSAPRPLATDEEAGFLLLEDFGDRTYTRALAEGADESLLYALATDLLIALHQRWPAHIGAADEIASLSPYDARALEPEVLLLTDWYHEAVTGRPIASALREDCLALWRALWPLAAGVPTTLVLRDYHVDNLMILEGRAGVAACGLLDFQDALVGPVTYDLVSLLEDARRAVSPGVVDAMRARYLAAFPALDRDAFDAAFALLGAQRNAKIIGIFTRLSRRDGKHGYLRLIPHVWRLLEGDLEHPLLADLKAWFDRVYPPTLRRAPELGKEPS